MKKLVIIAVVALSLPISAGWYVMAQSTRGDRLPTFARGDVLRASDLNAIVDGVRSVIAAMNGTDGPPIMVDCRTGDTTALGNAIRAAAPGSTLQVTGTCNEGVTITQDGLTLDGQARASTTIDGNGVTAITIDGARRVTIRNVTAQNGEHGIRAVGGASVTLENVTAQRNSKDGFRIVRNATAQISNCTAQDNGEDGFVINSSAQATFTGTITSTGNAERGIRIAFASSAAILGAMVSASANGNSATFGQATFEGAVVGSGIRVTDSSHLYIEDSVVDLNNNASDGVSVSRSSSFAALAIVAAETADGRDHPVTLNINGNGSAGVRVDRASHFLTSGSLATLTVRGNTGAGIHVQENASVNVHNLTVMDNGSNGITVLDNGTFNIRRGESTISNNRGTGLGVFRSSSVFLLPTVQILNNANEGLRVGQNSQVDARSPVVRNNQRGVVVDDSSLSLQSATVTGNTTDNLSAAFGSRLSLNGTNDIGSISCASSVLSRGNPTCLAP